MIKTEKWIKKNNYKKKIIFTNQKFISIYKIKSALALLLFILILQFQVSSQVITKDWLIHSIVERSQIKEEGKYLELNNGLISRKIYISPNATTTSFKNLVTGEEFVRAVKPEAQIVINNKTYNIGGLYGQSEKAYLENAWIPNFKSHPEDFQFLRYQVENLQPVINWKCNTWASNKKLPTGKYLKMFFKSSLLELNGIEVVVHYTIYDEIPVLSKWVTVENKSNNVVKINQIVNEWLAVVEDESSVTKLPQKLYIENDINLASNIKEVQSVHWLTDTAFTSQVNWGLETRCILKTYPTLGINIDVKPNESFTSMRTYELILDSYDRERNGLAKRRMYRKLFPWTSQNPIFMHLLSSDPVQVKSIIDQCVATGYEMVILSFGSDLDMEDTSMQNINKFKALADYAHSKNILIGCYSLFSSRSIGPETDVIDPKTRLPNKGALFGQAPCLASQWGIDYLKKLDYFIDKTGFDMLEHDGPYPGDVCASTKHAGHKGLDDSRWEQLQMQKNFYRALNAKGIYINAPDWYFLDGSNKIGLGYKEVNFSLPRPQQIILNRQNIYDGFWDKTPSMGWGFVPLTKYQGGTEDAILEPLSEHLSDYKSLMFQFYGAGVQACYRGPRLYDTDSTKMVVKNMIDWYKKYRDILNADIIHLRRADGRDWDGIMHVDPNAPNDNNSYKGLVLLYNPLHSTISKKISLPLYYTGLTNKAFISVEAGVAKLYNLNRDYSVDIDVSIPAKGYIWLLIK